MHIPTEHIEPDLKAKERFEAISELLDQLVCVGAIERSASDSISHALREREAVLSTGVGGGIALPHAITSSVSEPVIAFGRSQAGVRFNSLDGQPVHFIFLYILPSEFAHHLRTLKFIGQGFKHLKAIRFCSTAQEISDLLNDDTDQ